MPCVSFPRIKCELAVLAMCGLFSSKKVTSEAVACRNGSIRKGDRVQTQYEREEGGDDRWYCGVVVEAYTTGKVRCL